MRVRGNRRNFRLLTAAFLFWFSVYTYPTFLSSYAEGVLRASPFLIGLIVGSYGFTQMLLRVPLGILSDYIKKRKVFVMAGFAASMAASAGLAVISLLSGGGAPAPLAWGALIFRGLSGVAASTWVTFTVLYSADFAPERSGDAISRLMLPQYASQLVAMLLGARLNRSGGAWAEALLGRALAFDAGPTLAFLLATVAGLAGLIVLARVGDAPPTGEGVTLRGVLSVARDRSLIVGTLLSTLFHLVCWATVLGFVQNWALGAVAGFDSSRLGWLSVMYLLPNTLLARLSGGVLARTFGAKTVLTAGFLLTGAACACYPAARSAPLLFLVQGVFGAGMGLILPITMAGAIQNIPNEKRGAAMGLYQAVYGLGMFAGPVVAGAVIAAFGAVDPLNGYRANFYLMALISAAGAVLSLLLAEKRNGGR